nr:aminotransferase class III-fold pyridoxal phosphate-dependent enzyme [Oscillatoria laete-virens]
MRRYESQNVTYIDSKFPIFWDRAKGANVWDVDGNRFLDFTCAFGVTTLGHSNPQIVSALQRQSRKLLQAMGDVHPSALKPLLCEQLSAITFERWTKKRPHKLRGKTILCNSGFEAVEAALKTAYLKTKKREVLAFTGSYHGLGYGAVDVTGWKEFRDPFKRQIARFTTFVPYPYCYRCPFDNTAPNRTTCAGSDQSPACSASCQGKLRDTIRSKLSEGKIGAILVEPIQGRGGEIIPPGWFLPMLREFANEFGIPLIFDEIYTGFHRTGSFFACEDVGDGSGVIPDMICIGKALTGGFPMSACIGENRLMDEAWPESTGEAIHTSTFLGHPVGCAMALESIQAHLRTFDNGRVGELSGRMSDGLFHLMQDHPIIGDIRVKGLMAGVELIDKQGRPDAKGCFALMKSGLEHGLILLGGGVHHNVLSLNLNLCLSLTEIDYLISILNTILSNNINHE